MSQPSLDYSQYNLQQLYNALYHGDLDAFPERLTAIKRQIELKGGDPNFVFLDDAGKTTRTHRLFCQLLEFIRASLTGGEHYEARLSLKIVRWVVGLLYCPAVLFFAAFTVTSLSNLDFEGLLIVGIPTLIFAFMCWLGVTLMRASLRDVPNKPAVEMSYLSALGLAPLSGLCYMVMSHYALLKFNWGYFIFFEGTVFFPVGFYMPFVLLTYWLKYKYRRDEF